MLMPSIFGESLFDDFMDDFAFPRFNHTDRVLYGNNASNLMKTDVKETEDGYTVDIDLPGFKKDEIKLQLEKGYLTVSAAKNVNNDEKDKNGKYVRRERFAGNVRRSFYVGEKVKEEEIHPKFENGILKLDIPKEEVRKVEQKKRIAIEG